MGQKSIIVNTPNKKNHSDAQDWAAIFNGLYGGSTGILPIGSKLVVGVNEEFVIINDGVFSLDGHMLRVKDGTKQFLKLPETEVGKKRIAYVVAQYVVNTKLEDDTLEFAILAGEQYAINPLPPQVTIGNIDRGDRLNQAIIAELLIDGNKAEVNRYGKKAIILPSVNELYTFNETTYINVGEDLNNALDVGNYSSTNAVTAKQIKNNPSDTAFVMEVYERSPGHVVQHLMDYDGKNHYIRGASSGVYTDWEKFASVNDTGWKTVSSSQADYFKVRKINDVVYMHAKFKGTFSPNNWAKVGTVPDGFRPETEYYTGGGGEGGVPYTIYIAPDGGVEINHRFHETRSWCSFAGTWLTLK